MTIHFSDEEYENIIREPFNWHLKEECPEHLREELQYKIDLISGDDTTIKRAKLRRFFKRLWPQDAISGVNVDLKDRVKRISVFVGSAYGYCRELYIGKRANQTVIEGRWAKVSGYKANKEIQIPEVELDISVWNNFLSMLFDQINVQSWESRYVQDPVTVYDGLDWHLRIEFLDGDILESSGYEKWPDGWDEIHKLLCDCMSCLE